ncbi:MULTISPECIES: DUF1064 domain-containing protein [Edaphosphingomonas]|uniref:DUF1064 domain-containing protein n=2 Tax=Edaphosphingomonas TaxID=3423724 RepID=A0A2T4HVZ0_9SPHN|nr:MULTISPECIES: DUF1064 domain-containing protein [Sphingomonas]MDX3884049.1 DUF1064 domain-containing protein [Sphingomonas sp.]OHT19927.1 hypothetical protein BHE75_01920 [Sphingomonas haloaromaticamans]PTD19917.1 DUF1064 domain-containing protein [Sphingomonas fennica]
MTRPTNKFGAKKTHCAHGHMHASRREAARCNDLHLLQRAGRISDLEQQPRFRFTVDGRPVRHPSGRQIYYTADFQYREDGRTIVEDAKGAYRDKAWEVRRAFFIALFPQLELREV